MAAPMTLMVAIGIASQIAGFGYSRGSIAAAPTPFATATATHLASKTETLPDPTILLPAARDSHRHF